MIYITIDGDDIGQIISSCYLSNDEVELSRVNHKVQEKVSAAAELLRSYGFDILFCAADGVAGRTEILNVHVDAIYAAICELAVPDMTFSAGTGRTLRQSYIALLYAKSTGKSRHCAYEDLT